MPDDWLQKLFPADSQGGTEAHGKNAEYIYNSQSYR